MKLIGITGAARSGKDTIGDYLRIRHGFTTLSFAAPLKRMICTMLEVSEDWLETHKDEHITGIASPRVLLQTLGTDWGRHMIDTNIWVNLVHHKVDDIATWSHINGIVLTDVRFNNEAEWIRANGGVVWEVIRPEVLIESTHISENGVDAHLINTSFINDGTIEDLRQQVEGALK